MLRYKTVLFDLDGTIVDSAPGIFATMNATFEHYGVHKTKEQLQKYLGPPLRVTMAENVPEDEVENATLYYRKIYEVDGIFNAKLYDGAKDMLADLKNIGCTICLATCKPKIVAERVLEHFDVAQYFDYVGGASLDDSVDTKTAVIETVLAQNCVDKNSIVMIGDRADDMIGAQNCKMPAVGALYGYGSQNELKPFNPVFLAETTAEISKYIKSTD